MAVLTDSRGARSRQIGSVLLTIPRSHRRHRTDRGGVESRMSWLRGDAIADDGLPARTVQTVSADTGLDDTCIDPNRVALYQWMDRARASSITLTQRFESQLQQDIVAEEVVTERWSNGPVEGQVE
jgi:hypothetical protein